MSEGVSLYARKPFDPTCVRRTTFSELRVGDQIDYWGAARPVVEYSAFEDGRVRIIAANEYGGGDFAVGPGEEPVWRRPRDGERE